MAATVMPAPTVVKAPDAFTMEQVRENQEDLMKRINGAVFVQDGETIPLIDIGPFFGNNEAAKKAVAAEVGKACREIGFFQIANHGVSLEARKGVMEQARRFFHELPQEKKEAIHIKYSKLFRGWEPTDYSNVNPDDWKEGDEVSCETKDIFNWAYEPKLDPTGGDGKYVEMDLEPIPAEGANKWPEEEDLPGFFASIQKYHKEVLTLARQMMKILGMSLDLPETHFDHMMTHPGTIARLIYYPPQKPCEATIEDEEIGLGAHTDYECFTLLLADETPGLEVLSPNLDPQGRPKWISAPPRPDCFTVNIADFMMRWTNGMYKSTIHRVVNRSPEKERYSVPFFVSINYDETVSTLPSCITPENPSQYPDMQAGPYALERLRATLKEAADEYHKEA